MNKHALFFVTFLIPLASTPLISLPYASTPSSSATSVAAQEQIQALVQAIEDGNMEIVQSFLSKYPMLQLEALLNIAIHKGSASIVEFFISKGADINKDWEGRTPLSLAAGLGHIQITETLLKHGADINAKGQSGFTPLLSAIANSPTQVIPTVELLLKHGASPNLTGSRGLTPLIAAIVVPKLQQAQSIQIVELLLNHGASPHATFQCLAPLHMATIFGRSQIVELLLKHGAAINIQTDGERRTPLHLAAWCSPTQIAFLLGLQGHNELLNLSLVKTKDYARIIEILLKHGVDTNIRDAMGLTALNLARRCGNQDRAQLLEQAAQPAKQKK